MEKGEGEIDSLYGEISITLRMFGVSAVECHVVERQMFQLPQRPRSEHNPGQDGVNDQDTSVCYSSCHAVRSVISDRFNASRPSWTNLLWNFPHALHNAEQVAAPQHVAPKLRT